MAHDGARWLPATLTSLARATRHPDVLVGVDTGSTDDTPELLAASLGPDRVVTLARETGFGAAVAAGLAAAPAPPDDTGDPDEDDDPLVRWVWLLHDDSAPAPDALAQLLRASDASPSAEVLGPKVRGWHDRRLLLEVGLTVTGSGRRETGLERGETDQGQHDGTRDVLAVGSAGMLVRREVWEALGGFDPRLALFRTLCPDIELSMQVSIPLLDIKAEEADLEIRFGAGGYADVEELRILDDEVTPVCSPDYLREAGPFDGFDTLDQVRAARLIRSPLEPWGTWFRHCGIDLPEPDAGAQFNDVGLVFDAAASGFGVSLQRLKLGAAWLESGRVVRLSRQAVRSPHSHFICWKPGTLKRWECAAFVEWLREALR